MIRWLSVTQTARRLGLTGNVVRDLITAGVLPAVKCGQARNSPYRVAEDAVLAYDRARTPVSTR